MAKKKSKLFGDFEGMIIFAHRNYLTLVLLLLMFQYGKARTQPISAN